MSEFTTNWTADEAARFAKYDATVTGYYPRRSDGGRQAGEEVKLAIYILKSAMYP